VRIAVLGIGNLLMRDEGVGIHVIRELEKCELPGCVELIDGGTLGPEALYNLGGVDRLVAVDAVRAGGEPGAVYRFTPGDVSDDDSAAFSLHDITFLRALKMAEATGDRPGDVVIIGVEPLEVATGLELTPVVRNRMPDIINLVLREIEDFINNR